MYFFYYYPIGVDVGRPRAALTTWSLILGMTAIFVFSVPLAARFPFPWIAYAYRPAELDFLTPLTACFLHGSWMHLLSNMIYIWVFGPPLERALGHVGLLVVFVITGYLGNLAQGTLTLFWMQERAWDAVVGASGATSGLLGWYLLRYYYSRVQLAYWVFLPLQGINRTGRVHLHVAFALLLWLLLQLVFALVAGRDGSTAYGAHLGGLAAGLLFGLVLGQVQRGRLEHLRVRADRYRDEGNPHAARGWMERYLDRVNPTEEELLAYARLLAITGDFGQAHAIYRALLTPHIEREEMATAMEIYLEARRGNGSFVLPPHQQRLMAFYLEKCTRFPEAVRAYLDLARVYPGRPEHGHALARAATLLISKLDERREGLEVLNEAIESYPHGAWRPLLENERRRWMTARA
jgi:membrane associated rhomboid family serine protease